MGDKTRFGDGGAGRTLRELAWVVLGTTQGMMVANIPAVIVGETLAHRVPMNAIRWVAAALFVAVGVATLLGIGQRP